MQESQSFNTETIVDELPKRRARSRSFSSYHDLISQFQKLPLESTPPNPTTTVSITPCHPTQQSAQASNLLPQHTTHIDPRNILRNIPTASIHQLGYCGPASFGLLFFLMLKDGTITTDNPLYQMPIKLLLTCFGHYYEKENVTLSAFIRQLSAMHPDTIQCALAPVFRIILLCTLAAKKTESNTPMSSDLLTFDDTFTSAEHLDSLISQIIANTSHLEASILKMKEVNKVSISPTLEHRSTYFSVADLFILSNIFHIKLDIVPTIIISSDLRTHGPKEAALEMIDRLNELSRSRPNASRPRASMTIAYQGFIFCGLKDDTTNINGYFDIFIKEANPMYASFQQNDLSAVKAMALLSHTEPVNFASKYLPLLLQRQRVRLRGHIPIRPKQPSLFSIREIDAADEFDESTPAPIATKSVDPTTPQTPSQISNKQRIADNTTNSIDQPKGRLDTDFLP